MSEEYAENEDLQFGLIIDGSAFYYALSSAFRGERFDYPGLLTLLRDEVADMHGLPSESVEFTPQLYFTSTDPNNEGQMKFNGFLESLGLTVVTDTPWDADEVNRLLTDGPLRQIRFSSCLSYTLGVLVGAKQMDHVIIVTDTFAMRRPVMDALERGVRVTIAFFGQYIDARWQQLLGNFDDLHFLDLSSYYSRLFASNTQQSTPPAPGGRHGIAGLSVH